MNKTLGDARERWGTVEGTLKAPMDAGACCGRLGDAEALGNAGAWRGRGEALRHTWERWETQGMLETLGHAGAG